MKYLIKMTPLEPYFFGTEQGFKYEGVSGQESETYYLRSKDMPEQTTILGMLRFMILQNVGILKDDCSYSDEEKNQMRELIGAQSFQFCMRDGIQDFGKIKEISPVFLVNKKGEYLVKNAYHNVGKKEDGKYMMNGYHPIQMSEKLVTSSGIISLPLPGQYDAKLGHADGFYNLNTREVIRNPFESIVLTGNQKSGKQNKEDGFFKKEVKLLKGEYSFAIIAELDKDCIPPKAICYMGQKKSAFELTTECLQNDVNLCEMVKKAFNDSSKQKETWYYALSDIVMHERLEFDSFCMIEQKQVRNLETNYVRNARQRLKRSMNQWNLIESGSVFYEKKPKNLNNDNCEQIGYNWIVQLGGN